MKGSSTHSVSSSRSGSVSVRRYTRCPREMTIPPRSGAGAAGGGVVDSKQTSSTVITWLSVAQIEDAQGPRLPERSNDQPVGAQEHDSVRVGVDLPPAFQQRRHAGCVESGDVLQVDQQL